MARAFRVETEESRFRLPLETRKQIKALMPDLDLDAREVVIRAVAELWQREIGTPERDIVADVDRILARLGMD